MDKSPIILILILVKLSIVHHKLFGILDVSILFSPSLNSLTDEHRTRPTQLYDIKFLRFKKYY